MSLIYQALKQSEQRISAAPEIALRVVPAAQAATTRVPIAAQSKTLGWAVVVVALGITIGYFFQQGFRGHASGANAEATSAAGASMALQAPPSVLRAATPTQAAPTAPLTDQKTLPEKRPSELPSVALPRALQPLPTIPLKLRRVDRLPQPPKTATTPVTQLASPVNTAQTVKGAFEPSVPTPKSTTESAQASAPTSAPAVALSALNRPIASTPDSSISSMSPKETVSEDVGSLFESMNQALASHDNTAAQRHLQSIESRLPEGSIARLRAQAWFAHQTGDLPAASRTYRLLLEKLPGDELSAINLVSIERQQNRPDQARAVVKRALRYNTNSTALHSASEQLSLDRVTP